MVTRLYVIDGASIVLKTRRAGSVANPDFHDFSLFLKKFNKKLD